MVDAAGVILLHDTARCATSRIYGPELAYERQVKCFTDHLKENPGLQVFDLPFGGGVTLVRKVRLAEDQPITGPDGLCFMPASEPNAEP